MDKKRSSVSTIQPRRRTMPGACARVASPAARRARASGRARRNRRATPNSPAHGRAVRVQAPALDRACPRPVPACADRSVQCVARAGQFSGDRPEFIRLATPIAQDRHGSGAKADYPARGTARSAGASPPCVATLHHDGSPRDAWALAIPLFAENWDSRFRENSVKIARQRTRWGSCSRSGTISLNACLLFQPASVVRYLLIHETGDTWHTHHSRGFWRLVDEHEPGGAS